VADRTRLLHGWGRTAPSAAELLPVRTAQDIAQIVRSGPARGLLARGLGRSYGDAAQNAGGVVLDMRGCALIGPIDPAAGIVTGGGGASLESLLRLAVPQGWFIPVSPGTRQVTLGGAVAADVHGKNHHRDGSVASHVLALSIVDGRGTLRTLGPDDELFWGVVGGMGLTGVVVEVTLQLRAISSAWVLVDTYRTANLDETMSRLVETDARRRYSVAWLDCLARGRSLGRGVVTAGDHASAEETPAAASRDPLRFAPRTRLRAPLLPPAVLNAASVRAFNAVYHRGAPRERTDDLVSITSFFHPLDVIHDWNRLYGPGGFVQYQFVTPEPTVVAAAIERLAEVHAPGFLAVLKRFGPGNRGLLSFPAPGWTLALDIPARIEGLARLLDDLDERVAASGGRVYLAKDSRLRPDLVDTMYPGAARWRQIRAGTDPDSVFRSDLARRLAL
jgi:decaprenylphospho-beta-D-ribofuranose 2-oxidase